MERMPIWQIASSFEISPPLSDIYVAPIVATTFLISMSWFTSQVV